MCGIYGILDFDQSYIGGERIRRMTVSLSHRGPDHEGVYLDNQVALGHRRLSIIDLSSAGNQPMVSEDGQVILVYNGETYNFVEMRDELRALGHKFQSSSDSEVILRAYLQWGLEACSLLNGMFALAIWDRRTETLHLVRDRFGIKPLYFFACPRGSFLVRKLKRFWLQVLYTLDWPLIAWLNTCGTAIQ